jgi:hypothetical protein
MKLFIAYIPIRGLVKGLFSTTPLSGARHPSLQINARYIGILIGPLCLSMIRCRMTQIRTNLEFSAILGSAITAWASVERSLFRIFLSALDGADPGAAAAAFYALQGFKPKLDVTSAALEARFSRHPLHSYNGHMIKRHSLLENWLRVSGSSDRKRASLRGKIRTASEERNKLAHYDKVCREEGGVEKFFLSKSAMSPLNWKAPLDEDLYDFEKILSVQNSFDLIYDEMEEFVSLINKTLGQQSISMREPHRALDPRPVIDRTKTNDHVVISS